MDAKTPQKALTDHANPAYNGVGKTGTRVELRRAWQLPSRPMSTTLGKRPARRIAPEMVRRYDLERDNG